MKVFVISDPAPALFKWITVIRTWGTVQRKGGRQLGLAWTSFAVLVGDFWDRGQSLSHLALLVRQDWSPSAPTSLSKVEPWSSSIRWIIGRCLSKLLLITSKAKLWTISSKILIMMLEFGASMIIDRPVYGLLRRRSVSKWLMIVLVPNSSFMIWIYCIDCPKFCFHFLSRTVGQSSCFFFILDLMPITPRHLPHPFSKLNHGRHHYPNPRQ